MAFANFCSIFLPLKKNEWSPNLLLIKYSLLHPNIIVAIICDKEIYPVSGVQGPVRQKEEVNQTDKDLFHVSHT